MKITKRQLRRIIKESYFSMSPAGKSLANSIKGKFMRLYPNAKVGIDGRGGWITINGKKALDMSQATSTRMSDNDMIEKMHAVYAETQVDDDIGTEVSYVEDKYAQLPADDDPAELARHKAYRDSIRLPESMTRIRKNQLRRIIKEALNLSMLKEEDDLEIELEDIENHTLGDAISDWMNYEDPDGDADGDGLPNYKDPEPHVSNADDWEVANLDALKQLHDKDMIPSDRRGTFTREDFVDSDGDRWPDRVEKELGTDPENPKSQPVDDNKDGIADRKGLSKLGAAAERMLNDPANKKTAAALGTAVAAAAGSGAISGLKQKRQIKARPKHQQRGSFK